MSPYTLIIGNKNYSSWSLRPWLLMRHLGIEFQEIRIPLYMPGSGEQILQFSPAGKVPVLKHGSVTVWDSLAICEYLADLHPGAWPAERAARTWARSISAEMHSGFAALRREMPMNVRARGRRVTPSEACRSDIARIQEIWRACRQTHAVGGPWLFGRFSIADAMFAPVATRFATYGVPCTEPEAGYMRTVLEDPALQPWLADAASETEVIASSEVGR
jgi:glutathione S-transferase